MQGYAFKCDECGKIEFSATPHCNPDVQPAFPEGWLRIGHGGLTPIDLVCSTECGIKLLHKAEGK